MSFCFMCLIRAVIIVALQANTLHTTVLISYMGECEILNPSVQFYYMGECEILNPSVQF